LPAPQRWRPSPPTRPEWGDSGTWPEGKSARSGPTINSPRSGTSRREGVFTVADTSVCLTAAGFSLSSGEASLEARVLAFVNAMAGCSLRQVVKGVAGRDSEVSGAVHALLSRGDLVNTGTPKNLALRVAGDSPAAGPGNVLGNAPKSDALPE
jgi:hypothetical protein